MNKGRDILLYLAVKYQGDWDKIFDAVKRKESFSEEDVEMVKAKTRSSYITMLDPDYPIQLKNVYKPPFVLFYYGDKTLMNDWGQILAVVGSRECSEYSEIHCRRIINELNNRFIISSGMALGIDAVAHHAAIDNGGKTIAVLASGIDHPYPKDNRDIYEKCKQGHLIISEYPGDIPPQKENFPFRNRIIIGLGWGVFIPEVKQRSGTSVSVGHALAQNKDVMIMPQPVKNGTHNNTLLSEGAILIENGEDILYQKN